MGFLVEKPAPRLEVLKGVAMPAFTEAGRRRYQAARRKNGTGAVEVSTIGRPSSAWNNRSEEHTSELQSLMRISYAVFCLKKKKQHKKQATHNQSTKEPY